jgi:hypothetical protein
MGDLIYNLFLIQTNLSDLVVSLYSYQAWRTWDPSRAPP